MFDFVFDLGPFLVPFCSHFGSPNRSFLGSIFALFLDVAPRGAQEAPKRPPRGAKRLQKVPQEAPKRLPRGPKRAQEHPKRPHKSPKVPQEEPKGKRKREEIGPKGLSEHHLQQVQKRESGHLETSKRPASLSLFLMSSPACLFHLPTMIDQLRPPDPPSLQASKPPSLQASKPPSLQSASAGCAKRKQFRREPNDGASTAVK